jgi:hypothetical protein
MSAKPRLALFFLFLLALLVSACGKHNIYPERAPYKRYDCISAFPGGYQFSGTKASTDVRKTVSTTKIQWKVLNSGAAVREAVIANLGPGRLSGCSALPCWLGSWSELEDPGGYQSGRCLVGCTGGTS